MRDSDAIEAFLEMQSAEKGASANTISAYRRDLAFSSESLGARLLAADRTELEGLIATLARDGMSPATQRRRLSSLRQFFRFLFVEGIRADNPALAIEQPRAARPLPKTLSYRDVTRLINQAREEAEASPAKLPALRMRALVELLYATGLRVSELVSLPVAVARRDADFFVVRGKGNKDRLIPLSPSARAALGAYLRLHDPHGLASQDAPLFPADGDSGHLCRQVFARDLKGLGARAGLRAAELSPHVLRHAFASHLVQNGADLRVVQQLLGHADISTTQIYTHVLEERLAGLVRDNHPLARARSGQDRE